MLYITLYSKGREIVARFPYNIGIVAFMAFPSLLKGDEGAAEKIKFLAEDPFFDLIEVGPIGGAEWSKVEDSLSTLDRRPMIALGLQPEILVRGYNPSSLSEDERRKAEKRLAALTQEACSRGYTAVALCSGPNVSEEDKQRAYSSFAKTVSAVAEEASACGMPVYVETFDTDVDKKRLVGRLEDASKLVSQIRESHGNVSILWDLSHAPLLGEKPEDLKRYSELIGHIHIGAAKVVEGRLYDWHPGFYRPGAVNDENDLARLLRVLDEMGYNGAVTFEVKPEDGQDLKEVLGASKEALVRAYRMVLSSTLT